jgi:hypothetical protein
MMLGGFCSTKPYRSLQFYLQNGNLSRQINQSKHCRRCRLTGALVPLVKFGGSIVPRLLLGGGLMIKAFSNAAFGVVAENKYYNPGRTAKS